MNTLLIAAVVLIHYEALRQLSVKIPTLSIHSHLRVLVGIAGALFAHMIEIWLFGVAYYVASMSDSLGSLTGRFDGSLMDSVYYSLTAYTSLGTGDIEPIGDLRFLAGLEALTGLVLIAWTASFMYLEMSRYWQEK
jgi:hypothetical protein